MYKIVDILNNIIQGNALEILKKIPDNSIDAVVTDPPYGLSDHDEGLIREVLQKWLNGEEDYIPQKKGFMGKEWDAFVPPPIIWKEVYRVIKPGSHILCFAGTRTVDLMSMSLRLAGFEIRDCLMWLYGCIDEKTEILTTEGFKKHNEIKVGDIVFSLSLKDGKIIKNKVKHIFKYQVIDEKMCLIKNHNTDQLVTLNHKVLLRERVRKQVNNIRKGEYETQYKYVDAYNLPHTFKLPLAGIYDGQFSVGGDFAELLGWIITEGHYQKDTNAINIYQSSINKEKVERIRYILGRCKIKYSEYQREREYKGKKYIEHQFYISDEIVDKIKSIIPDKKLNWRLLELPYKEKERLIIGLCAGDGSKGGKRYYQAFYQKDLNQLEIFQVLLHLTNKQGWINHKKYSCSIHYNNETEFQGKHKKQYINYTGIVWCIETEVGNFMSRRNGKIFITGNSGFPKSMDISKAIDKMKGVERKIICKNPNSREKCDKSNTLYKSGIVGKIDYITAPATPEAKMWEGYGTALKPAVEPIILARKPLSEKNVAENVLKWGTGGLNIDECRIGTEIRKNPPAGNKAGGNSLNMSVYGMPQDAKGTIAIGRFPSNFVIQCSCDEVIENKHTNPECPCFMLDAQSGISKSRQNIISDNRKNQGKSIFLDGVRNPENSYNDIGGASRFFKQITFEPEDYLPFYYCAKASKSERNMGLEGMPLKIGGELNATVSGDSRTGRKTIQQNNHPTVKPLKLLEYLIKLITPPNGIVLDPFIGSGTTGMACKKLGFNFIGIELNPEYIEIAKKRLEAVEDLYYTMVSNKIDENYTMVSNNVIPKEAIVGQ